MPSLAGSRCCGGTMTSQFFSAGEIARELGSRLEALVRVLAPDRLIEFHRRCIRIGNKGSLSIRTEHPHIGQWKDFETGNSGDALDLVRHFRGGNIGEAIKWAVAWLGKPAAFSPPTARQREVRPDNPLWTAIWQESDAAVGTPAECYLASRGLLLPPRAPLRFHPCCPHRGERLPAMLALMTNAVTGEPCGVHRTFLRPDGSGKADVVPSKMMLGRSGIIQLSDEVTAGLGIAEGIETSLAIMQHTGWSPMWAPGSAGAIARFPVLQGIEALTIFADCDDRGAGLGAAHTCATRWNASRREATIQQPPPGLDWLEALRGLA